MIKIFWQLCFETFSVFFNITNFYFKKAIFNHFLANKLFMKQKIFSFCNFWQHCLSWFNFPVIFATSRKKVLDLYGSYISTSQKCLPISNFEILSVVCSASAIYARDLCRGLQYKLKIWYIILVLTWLDFWFWRLFVWAGHKHYLK